MSLDADEQVLRLLERTYPCDLSAEEISSRAMIDLQRAEAALENLVERGLALHSRTISRVQLFSLDKIQLGIDTFNGGEFFEAHEILEDVWRFEEGPEKDFYRGLINLGVEFAHWERGKLRAATNVLSVARELLEPYLSICQDVDVAMLLEQLYRAIHELAAARESGENRKIFIPKIVRRIPEIASP
jgi:predicted metal-dependent hydrolase